MAEFVKNLCKIIFKILYRVELIGIDDLPKTGGFILCANHMSQLDMFFISYKIVRLVHWMAKEELFKNRITEKFFRSVGAFPVKRGSGDIGAIKSAINILKEGKIIGMFPEGTRVKQNMNSKPKQGVVLIAIKANVPIIPVLVKTEYKLFEKVTVIFGKPIYFSPDKKYEKDEIEQISIDIMNKVYKLSR